MFFLTTHFYRNTAVIVASFPKAGRCAPSLSGFPSLPPTLLLFLVPPSFCPSFPFLPFLLVGFYPVKFYSLEYVQETAISTFPS